MSTPHGLFPASKSSSWAGDVEISTKLGHAPLMHNPSPPAIARPVTAPEATNRANMQKMKAAAMATVSKVEPWRSPRESPGARRANTTTTSRSHSSSIALDTLERGRRRSLAGRRKPKILSIISLAQEKHKVVRMELIQQEIDRLRKVHR